MSKENILLIISIFLSIVIIAFSIYIFFYKGKNQNTNTIQNQETEETQEEENINEDIEETTPSEFIHSAWIPAFDFDNGYKSLQEYKDLIKEVNPVLYGVNSDGTLLDRKPSESTLNAFLTFCSNNSIDIIPTVGSYDYKIMESVLSSDVYIEKLAEKIVSEVEKYNYKGIDIDYEKIHSEQKEGYILFLKTLKTKLNDKVLSVTVSAKTRDAVSDSLYVQDWIEIGKIADKVKIMAYDYTFPTSTTPGPIGPTDWIKEVLEYSNGKIPAEKISLGIHLYAYLWKGEKLSALTYSSVLSILKSSSIQTEYKDNIGEGYAQYTCSGGSQCIMYYQTPEGIQERIRIAKEYNLAGVSYWRLGGDENILKQ